MRRKLVMVGILMALLVVSVAGPAWAGGSSGPLSSVYADITAWAQGNVGKVIALGMILVGIVAGIANQSLMAFAVGIGGGLGLYNAPTIIDTIFNATLTAGML